MQTATKAHNPVGATARGRTTHAGPTLRKRIGSTVYEVHVHFNRDGRETMNDKIMRLVTNDLNHPRDNVILKAPQMNRLPERGSL